MRKIATLIVAVLLAVFFVPFAQGTRLDLKQLESVPHNFLTPDYFPPQPAKTIPTDDTINVRINSDNSGQIQNEQQVCINPINPNNVVAVWRDFRLGYRRVGHAYSFDGGLTWTDELFPVTGRPWHSDPGLTYDVNGNFYAVVIAFESDQSYSGFEIFKSSDGGITWSYPTIGIDEGGWVFEDKELMACDRAPDSPYQGNLYIAWTRFYDTQINVIRSTDGNNSWSPRTRISDVGGVQWPNPTVGAGGVVYVAWVDYGGYIKLDRSFNGGVSWGNDITITSVYSPDDYINGDIWVFSYPAIDADISGGQYHGNLYVAYMDKAGSDRDIYFRRSTNQGQTWSSRVRINDDAYNNGRDQFHPWLTVDENGVITVMFYDRRNDPSNLRYDIYMTQSFDAGYTWTENRRVTTVSSDPSTINLSGLIGEYSGVDVRNGVANLVWTDFRLGDQDTYGARIETYGSASLSISMIPDNPPIVVPAGGSFNYTGMLTNNESEAQITDVWLMLDVPNYGIYGPINEMDNILVPPNQTLSAYMTQDIPGYAPIGMYNYISYCGDYPSNVIDSDYFEFEVVPSSGQGNDSWAVGDWFAKSNPVNQTAAGFVDTYPNPFNAETTIKYSLLEDSPVRLEIYNILGRKVSTLVDEEQPAGVKSVNWNASDYSSGVYYAKLDIGEKSFIKRMLLLK